MRRADLAAKPLVISKHQSQINLKESKVLVEVDLTGDDGTAISLRQHAGHVHLVVEEVHHGILHSTTARVRLSD